MNEIRKIHGELEVAVDGMMKDAGNLEKV